MRFFRTYQTKEWKDDGQTFTLDDGTVVNNKSWLPKDETKIRYMSDLHLDYNYDYPFTLKDKETFTAIAGDVSGYYEIGKEWLKENIHNGVFVEGNHIFYNNDELTLQDLYKRIEEDFPIDSNVSFLQNKWKKVGSVIIFGATLWTDCRFYGNLMVEGLRRHMNDYRYGKYEENGVIRKLEPEDTIKEFKKTLKILDELCNKYPNDKIVVLTHHCPSWKCLSPYYRSGDTNQGYASHLESYIRSHGNIAAWICGHSHHCTKFDIDGCKVLMNCRGYVRHYEDVNFRPNRYIKI